MMTIDRAFLTGRTGGLLLFACGSEAIRKETSSGADQKILY